MLYSIITSLAVALALKLFDHYVPSFGALPLLKTRRDTRRMLAAGYHIDYAGQWRHGIGMDSMVSRTATAAELRYVGRSRDSVLPVDGHRELTGGL